MSNVRRGIGRRHLLGSGSALAAGTVLLAPVRSSHAAAAPIQVHPENPRYFLWRGKPRILLGASEHFGAVVNAAADHKVYLDTIAATGSNITRVFSGTLIEPYTGGDYLQVDGDKFIAPWARSNQPGYTKGGNKFDLSRFDPAYFARLRAFATEAGKRGIVVLYVFFTQQFDDKKWSVSPFNPNNNINDIKVERDGIYTLDRNGGLLPYQEALVRKVVSELRSFDNVIYEVTYTRVRDLASPDWERHVTDVLFQAQKKVGDKKIVAQNVGAGREQGEVTDPRIGMISHTLADQSMLNYYTQDRRPIGMAETGFVPSSDREARMRAWDFVLRGAGMFIHVDHTFGPKDHRGTRLITKPEAQFGAGPVQRQQLHQLIQIVNAVDFIKMRPAPELVKGGLPPSLVARVFADPGRTYLVYVRPTPPPKAISVRWTGKLLPKRSGPHTLHTRSNDGVRLWLDGKLILDNWLERGPADDVAQVHLEAGKGHDLRLDYFYTGGTAEMRLEWQGADLPREVVPAAQLRTPQGEAGGLRAEYFIGRSFDTPYTTRRELIDYTAKAGTAIFAPPAWTPGPINFALDVTEGEYRMDWIDPASGGRYAHPETVRHPGGAFAVKWPHLTDDILLRLLPA